MTATLDVLANLQAARLLIDDKADWTRCTNAKNRNDMAVPAYDDAAVRWCARGAIVATEPDMHWLTVEFVQITLERRNSGSLTEINDNLGHVAVKRTFDRLIKECLKELEVEQK